MVYTGRSTSTVHSSFFRRKKIHVNSSSDGALTAYQLLLTIAHESEMQADFDDIRFNEMNGNHIDYWIESKTDSSTAQVWIETDVPATGGKDIWMYYGNSTLAAGSDGEDTFNFFDDFPGTTIDSTKWSDTLFSPTVSGGELHIDMRDAVSTDSLHRFTGGYALKLRARNTSGSTSGWHWAAFEDTRFGTSDVGATSAMSHGAGTYYQFISGNGSSSQADDYTISASGTSYHTWEAKRTGTADKFSADGGTDITGNYPTNNSRCIDINGYSCGMRVDWIFVRKYTANEPTTSIGYAQHQRRTPQFIN